MMTVYNIILRGLIVVMVAGFAQTAHAQNRNASFVNPGSVTQKSTDTKASQANTLVAEPASIDAGETLVNIARRVTVFFYNGFRSPIQINDLTLNADGNVRSRVVADDCKTVKTLPVQDKCSVALEITPSSPGPWSVELLMNHSGMGRIARAEVNGTTLGKADEKSEGLAISKKIAAPMDFGAVVANEEKAARTMLIENDSPLPLVISSIDLISTQQDGLSVRKNGCKENDELKPGESCPITVMWEPTFRGNVATDLIVRHSGNLGFVVVPIRGAGTLTADKEDTVDPKTGKTTKSSSVASLMPRGSMDSTSQTRTSMPALDALPLPSSSLSAGGDSTTVRAGLSGSKHKLPPNVKNMVGKGQDDGADTEDSVQASAAPRVTLIGTVGKRAILGDAQEQTYMVNLGDKVSINGSDVELLQLDPTRAVVMMGGQRVNLSLRNMQTIAHQSAEKTDGGAGTDKSSKSGSSSSKSKDTKVDSSAAKRDIPTPSTGLPTTGSSGPGLGDLSSPTSSSKPTNNAMTAQDVLNLIK